MNSVFVEILKSSTNTKFNVICGCTYRPPFISLKTFNELLSRTLNKLKNQNNYIYITGDFNVNTVSNAKGSLATQDFKNILSSNFLHPFINKPTRITSHSATLINNIYCNIPEIGTKYDSGILCTSISDHYAIICISKQNMNQSTNNLITKRSFCDMNVYNFHNRLKMSLGILFVVENVCKVRSHGSKES